MIYLVCLLTVTSVIQCVWVWRSQARQMRRLREAYAEIRRLYAKLRITRKERDHAIIAARRAQVKVRELLQARHDTPGEAAVENTERSDHATG